MPPVLFSSLYDYHNHYGVNFFVSQQFFAVDSEIFNGHKEVKRNEELPQFEAIEIFFN